MKKVRKILRRRNGEEEIKEMKKRYSARVKTGGVEPPIF